MRYIEFGNTGRKVSVIGIGCMRMDDLLPAQVDSVIDLALEKEQDKNELDYNKYLLNLRTEVIGFKNS